MVTFRLAAGTAIVGLILGMSVRAEERTKFQTDYATAQQLATQSGRFLVVHFWAPWCEPCLRMEHDVFSQPQLGPALEKRFVLVKVNRDRDAQLAEQMGVRYLPTDVVLSPDGRILARLPASLTAQDYLTRLNEVAAGGTGLAGAPAPQMGEGPTAPPIDSAAAPSAPVDPNAAPTASAPSPPRNDEYLNLLARRSREQATLPYDQAAPAPQAPLAPLGGPAAGVDPAAPGAGTAWAPTAGSAPVAHPGQAEQVPLSPAEAPLPDQAAGLATAHPHDPAAYNPAANNPTTVNPTTVNPATVDPAAHAPHYGAAPAPVAAPGAPAAPPLGALTAAGHPAPQAVASGPSLGLEGYCPVQLYDHYRWVPGRPQWGAVFEGRTYLFAGPEEQRMFLANPARYSPVAAGIDPVLALEQGQAVEGRREFGVVCDGRVFLFATEATRQRFEQAPDRYSGAILQATRPTTVR